MPLLTINKIKNRLALVYPNYYLVQLVTEWETSPI